ncbi:MAG: hypothetical protein V1887_01980 [Candidatus Aenigmatarchaeota archaeon]
MNLNKAAEIEKFRQALSERTKRPVVYDAQIDAYRSGPDGSVLKITRDAQGTAGRIEIDGETFPFEYDPQTGRYT